MTVTKKQNVFVGSISCLCVWYIMLGQHYTTYTSKKYYNDASIQDNINSIYSGQQVTRERNITLDSQTFGIYYRPWPKDETCAHYYIRTANRHSLPFVALASFPGSGNTWLRYLLDTSSGIFTGSQYRDDRLHRIGLYGEMEDYLSGTTIVQKTHDYDFKALRRANKTAILLIRNPYKSLIAFYNLISSGSHIGYASVASFKNDTDWSTELVKNVRVWEETAVSWITNAVPGRLLVMHFEELSSNILKQLLVCLKFLGVIPDPERLSCLMKNLQGITRRPLQCFPEDLILFSEDIMAIIDCSIARVNKVLVEHGHNRLPTHLYKKYRSNPSISNSRNDDPTNIYKGQNNMTTTTNDEGYCIISCGYSEEELDCYDRIDNFNNSRFFKKKLNFGLIKPTLRTTQSTKMHILMNKINELKTTKNYNDHR